MRWIGTRGIRGRLLVAVVVAVGAAVVVQIVAFDLVLASRLSADATAVARARATGRLSALSTAGDRLRVPETPDDRAVDSQVWVFTPANTLERPTTSLAVNRAARLLATSVIAAGRGRRMDVASADARLLALPVAADGEVLGAVVAGVSLAPYERTKRVALIASIALGLLVLVAVAIAARWVLAAALSPVARMTTDAAEWSEHDLDRRFGQGPPRDEITQLAATLDGLLDRLAASLRHERRFSSELSHELRTPLAKISAQAQLALRGERDPGEYREALTAILSAAQALERTLDALLAGARADAGELRGVADARPVAVAAAEDCAGLADGRDVIVTATPESALRVGVDPDLVERILHPVIENACHYGAGDVRISIARADGEIWFQIDDEGPGVTEEERTRIFEPGVRGSAAAALDDEQAGTAGLGLALARRLARAAGGDVEALPSGGGGSFRVRLPAA
jgi:signal transduction histidine kinase